MNIYLFPNKLNQMINIILKNLIEELLFQENYDIIYNGSSGKGSHQTVWNLFSTVKELNTLGIHNSGYRMLEKRKCADYIPNETITKTDMALMNREAEKIINKLT